MKNLLLLCIIGMMCSSCAIGAGISGFSLVSGSLTQEAEKNLMDKAYLHMKNKEQKM